MTKDQFKEFVKTAIKNRDDSMSKADPIDDIVEMIVAQWESDVNDARIAGQDEGVQSDYMAAACMGPCCGGSI